jgi:hypothetical protein
MRCDKVLIRLKRAAKFVVEEESHGAKKEQAEQDTVLEEAQSGEAAE